ncbi:MAG TPA: M56 family metallopeptidase [Gemmatimonadaceae bacterium]|nr:M56 family metallopeptidase [Gemmatimonadaceae bacterium]
MIDILIRATILLVLVAGAAQLLRRRSAALRHLLWSLAIAGLVALPALTAVVPFRLHVLPTREPVLTEPLANERDTAVAHARSATHAPASDAVGDRSGSGAAPDATPLQASEIESEPGTSRPALATILGGIWLAGVLALLARFIVGLIVVGRMARRATAITDERWHALADRAALALGVATPVDLRLSDEVAMPFACGLLARVIVLPTSSAHWSMERREAVLMHEFAHISRGDLAMNMLSHITRALYWPHPLAWLAAHKLRVEGERACDDAVLRAGTVPSDYAEHLLSIVRTVAGTPPVPTAAVAMARKSEFEGRLLAILEPEMPRNRLTRWRAVAMAGLFLTVVMPLAAMSPAPAAPAPARQPEAEMQQPQKQDSLKVEVATLQSGQATGAVAALIETLSDANGAVRLAAVKSLGQLGDPRAIAALAKALREDSDARVREAAAYALGEIDDSRAVAPLLEALKNERVGAVKEKIVRALGEIDDPSAVPGIIGVLKDASIPVRRAAVWALGELEEQSAVASLLTMVKDDDVEVRQQTAQSLGELKGETPGLIDGLAALARDVNSDVRQHAIEALGNLEDPRILGPLVAALKDSNADVRSAAADAIDNIDNIKQAPAALIEALNDPNRDVRKNAAESLGSIGDVAAVPALKRLTSDSDTEIRRAAVEALRDIGGPEAIQVLMGMLKDSDPEVRRVAAEALGSKRH